MVKVTNEMLRETFGTTDMAEIEAVMEDWHADGGCEATDGCWVEPDGTCEHGKPGWLVVLGVV